MVVEREGASINEDEEECAILQSVSPSSEGYHRKRVKESSKYSPFLFPPPKQRCRERFCPSSSACLSRVVEAPRSCLYLSRPNHNLHNHVPVIINAPLHELKRLLRILEREAMRDETVDVERARREKRKSFGVRVAATEKRKQC
jgi:hypothetical protein